MKLVHVDETEKVRMVYVTGKHTPKSKVYRYDCAD